MLSKRKLDTTPMQVGDSLMRFQYVSLAHFMAHGVWLERCVPMSIEPAVTT